MLCVVRLGDDFVFATHTDSQKDEIAGLYDGQTVQGPNGADVTIPQGVVVQVPNTFRFAYDDVGRQKDPRRFATAPSTPIGT